LYGDAARHAAPLKEYEEARKRKHRVERPQLIVARSLFRNAIRDWLSFSLANISRAHHDDAMKLIWDHYLESSSLNNYQE
jgi:hypothetical protein